MLASHYPCHPLRQGPPFRLHHWVVLAILVDPLRVRVIDGADNNLLCDTVDPGASI